MTQRVVLEPVFVLSLRRYRESSALLEVFSENHGRVGLVARGVQGPRSRWRGLLQAFRPLLLSWSERGELGSLTGVESAPTRIEPLSGEAVLCGWYLNELLLRLLARHDAHPQLFARYQAALQALASGEGEVALRPFEKNLLDELGYGLSLPADLDPEATYRYDWDEGPQPAADGYRGDTLMALAEDRLSGARQLREARQLLREALARHGAGTELKTPKLLREMRETLKISHA